MILTSTNASFGSSSNAATHRRGDPGNGNHIIVPFAEKLMESLVEEGDELVKGDVVAIVRPMKMELEIRANKEGRVLWFYEGVEEEDIGEGVLIAELQTGTGAKL